MALNNTGNAVPSNSPLDLQDNAIVLDDLINGDTVEVVSRTGKKLKGIAALQEIITSLDLGSFTFSDTATGISGTTDGQYFRVPSSTDDIAFIYYKNSSGSAVEVAKIIGNNALDSVVAYEGYLGDKSVYKTIDGSGINYQGELVGQAGASCNVIPVLSYDKLYLTNSAGDLDAGSGRSGAFYTDLNNYSSSTNITLIQPVPTELKTSSGLTVYKLEIPEDAVVLLINTSWESLNPNGFSVDIYSTITAAEGSDKTETTADKITISNQPIKATDSMTSVNYNKSVGYVRAGNLTASAYMQWDNYGVNGDGKFSVLNTATSVAIPVTEGERLYLLNSAGDFALNNGRGLAFYSDKYYIRDENLLSLPSLEAAGKDANGVSVFTTIVPQGAACMVVNTAFTQYNPNGFSVYISPKISDIYDKATGITEEKITSLYGKRIIGVSRDDLSLVYSGNLTPLTAENPDGYGINGDGQYGSLYTAKSVSLLVNGYKILYVFNTAGDFNSGSGRGLSFFSDKESWIDSNYINSPFYPWVGTSKSGYLVYAIAVPENAEALVVNTAFTQYNSDGFSVGIFSDLESALEESNYYPAEMFTGLINIPASAERQDDYFGHNRFAGQEVFVFGDSISTTNYNGGWVPYFATATRCLLQDFATNGSEADRMVDKLRIDGLARRKTTDTDVWPVPDFTDCKAVLLMIGTNDQPDIPDQTIDQIIPSGNVYNAADELAYWESFPNSYVGNVALFIEYVKSKNLESEIFIMSNVHRQDDKSKMDRVSLLCKQIANYYSLPHIDCTNNAGFSYKFLAKYLQDGIHPTREGMRKLGIYITNAVISS
ncbi:SGNH/GDSL hydrolase family protein [Tatumella sp. UCD-D_suzukii]|uniref:SGNH/GDSL hydrolase family protein n=1 Tax=Tatumella sp. UCD-D_suzukii TaxID=1408192 RepID=UPI000472D6AD|nr:SGNH/GDSL hydrolase family protein [Tatumella sp. UCD-D_suzukii]